jgi:YHS domain-containing protein
MGLMLAMVLVTTSTAQINAAEGKVEPKVQHQTTCPLMGGKIDKSIYADHNGKRVYFCCAMCGPAFKKDPAKYIKMLEDKGITLAKTPAVLCHKCGEFKGEAKCCKKEGRNKCGKCNLLKGSPGCCKLPKDLKAPAALCGKCGEVRGEAKCCKAEGREKCGKCHLFKGSPGCCKLPKPEAKAPGHEHKSMTAKAHMKAHEGGKAKAAKAGCCGTCGGM